MAATPESAALVPAIWCSPDTKAAERAAPVAPAPPLWCSGRTPSRLPQPAVPGGSGRSARSTSRRPRDVVRASSSPGLCCRSERPVRSPAEPVSRRSAIPEGVASSPTKAQGATSASFTIGRATAEGGSETAAETGRIDGRVAIEERLDLAEELLQPLAVDEASTEHLADVGLVEPMIALDLRQGLGVEVVVADRQASVLGDEWTSIAPTG